MAMTRVQLQSSDGDIFEVDEVVVFESQKIKDMIEGTNTPVPIPLPDISSQTLAKVIEYCKYHMENQNLSEAKEVFTADEVQTWNENFLNVDDQSLFDLIMAADSLNIKSLMDVTARAIADKLKGNSVEEIRRFLNITNDFTPEEEEEVRRENQWAF